MPRRTFAERYDLPGVAMAAGAFLVALIPLAVARSLTSGWLSSTLATANLWTGMAAVGWVYSRRVRAGRVGPGYPPLDRGVEARPVQPRPTKRPLVSWQASQVGGARQRGGHLRLFDQQLRFDPIWAGPQSTRAWVAGIEEVVSLDVVTASVSPRRFARPLLSVRLTDGAVADFNIHRAKSRCPRLQRELARLGAGAH